VYHAPGMQVHFQLIIGVTHLHSCIQLCNHAALINQLLHHCLALTAVVLLSAPLVLQLSMKK